MERTLVAIAGLMGALGVTLAAASAHIASGLDWAASMLLFHAIALVALSSLLDRGLVWRPLALLAALGFVSGTVLFSGDIALRTLAQARLFPMAAPAGGAIMIGAWLTLGAAALIPALRR